MKKVWKSLLSLTLMSGFLLAGSLNTTFAEKSGAVLDENMRAEKQQNFYVESKGLENQIVLGDISIPEQIQEELSEDAVLTDYSEDQMFVKIESGKESIITVAEAEELKKKYRVSSLSELVDIENAKRQLSNLKSSKESTVQASPAYDSDTVTMYNITGKLYTYTEPGNATYASRARLFASWEGLSLIPGGSDSKRDYISMGWATDQGMYIESATANVHYTKYNGSQPDQYATVNIINNRHIWSSNKISLFYNDIHNTSYVPTLVWMNVYTSKTTKSNKEGFAEAQFAHSYSNTTISPQITVGWPPSVSIGYGTTTGHYVIPVGARFQF